MKAADLAKWRESKDLTQAALAKLLGVHTITVNRWENGAREIPPFLPLALETIERNQKPKTKK